jgi:hypothetical protein
MRVTREQWEANVTRNAEAMINGDDAEVAQDGREWLADIISGKEWEDWGRESTHESTFTLTGAAVIPGHRIVLPSKTMVVYGPSVLGDMDPWAEDEIMAARPSDNHSLVFAAVWVPDEALDES